MEGGERGGAAGATTYYYVLVVLVIVVVVVVVVVVGDSGQIWPHGPPRGRFWSFGGPPAGSNGVRFFCLVF